MKPHPFDPNVVVADALVAASDDVGVHLTRRDATRLAARLIDHLAVLGWQLHEDQR